jgi:chitodextrinase
MKIIDLQKQAAIITSAATITLGAALDNCRTVAQAINAGEVAVGDIVSMFRRNPATGAFESGPHRIDSPTQLTRQSITSSSNNGNPVDFGGAAVEVYSAASGSYLSGVDAATLAAITPADTHKLVVLDPATGLAYTATVAALRTLFGGSAPASDTVIPAFGSGASLTSTNVGQTGFTLSWPAATDNVGVARYEYSTDGGTSWTNVGNVLTVGVTGKTASTTYPCRVRAVDTSGNVSAQLSVSVTTAAAAGGTNSAPTLSGSLTTTNVIDTSYTMNWPAATDPDNNLAGYDVSTDGGTTWAQLGNVLTSTVNNATANTLYNLRVRARDTGGLTSNVLSATVTTTAAVVYDTFKSDMRGVTAAGNPTVYTGDGTANSENQAMGAVFSKKFADKTDGSFTCVIPNNGGNYTLAVASIANTTVLTPQSYAMVGVANAFGTDYPYNIFSKAANFGGAATTTTAGVKPVGSDKFKFDRINSDKTDGTTTLIISVARAATPNQFTELYRFTGVSNGELGIRWYINGGTPSISQMQSNGLVAF